MSCELCGRDKDLSFHHLIPRTTHSNNWFKKNFTRKEMKDRGLMLCYDCHLVLHQFYNEKTLGRQFNTKELILSDEKMSKAIKYNSKQK